MQFRKRPIVIEAFQLPGADPTDAEVNAFRQWSERVGLDPHLSAKTDSALLIAINTPEGQMVAAPGDWIIRGVKGEFYPCKPDIFEATYAPVGSGDPLGPTPADLLRELIHTPHWDALAAKLTATRDAKAAEMVTATYTHHEDLLQANRTQAVVEWLTDFLGNPEAFLGLNEKQPEEPKQPPIRPRPPVGRLYS